MVVGLFIPKSCSRLRNERAGGGIGEADRNNLLHNPADTLFDRTCARGDGIGGEVATIIARSDTERRNEPESIRLEKKRRPPDSTIFSPLGPPPCRECPAANVVSTSGVSRSGPMVIASCDRESSEPEDPVSCKKRIAAPAANLALPPGATKVALVEAPRLKQSYY